MVGWMIVFALLAILGTARTLANPAAVSTMMGVVFALLFLLGLLTRFVRGRAW
jgi:energy-converting hydrogenase Eha subunit F